MGAFVGFERIMRDIVEKVCKIEAELKRRRECDPLAAYNTGEKKHEKQLAFHKCLKRNRWVFGGNRSGKTECGAVECVYMARGVHPYRENRKDVCGWVVSLSTQVQRDVAQKKILRYLRKDQIEEIVMQSGRRDSPEDGIIDFIRVKNALGGSSVIGFKSCDQGREKFQGASLDFVWFDEEPPEDIYRECRMRVMDRRGDIFGTMTPLKGLTFVHNEIFLNRNGDPEVWYEFVEWSDNPYLDEDEIRLMESSMDERTLQARRYGRFATAAEGLVYPEFDERIHVIEPFSLPREWQDMIAIDPGLNNPLSAHWYAVDFDDNVYVVYEHYEAGRDIDYHAERILDICERLDWKRDRQGRVCALIDSAAKQRTLSGMKSVVELFYERGILVNPNVEKDLFSGISMVKRYLNQKNGLPNLYIFSSCTHLIGELKGYYWGSGDAPKKVNDHSLDELRYYLMSRPKKSGEMGKTAIQKDKERRVRKLKKKPFEY
ncbi:MAG: terminase family protein [Clostridia bacterium]|nr:terminase family protein [Clostridia bacterium]